VIQVLQPALSYSMPSLLTHWAGDEIHPASIAN